MSFWVYILRCSDGSYYTGHTDNLEGRIGQHQSGTIEGYTQTRRPVVLAWSQDFPSRIEALEAERQIKGWTRVKKEALMRSDWQALHEAAIPPAERALRLRSGRTEEGESVTKTDEQMDDVALDTPPSVRAERSRSTAPSETPETAPAPPPVLVLVRPQLGENIGKAARAMLNFGLTELRLVSPRDGWPNPGAGPAASGADIVLEQAQVFETVAEAIADCAHVYATTVRKRGVTKPVVTPEAAAQAIHATAGRSAILFGPERSGLETDDVAVARSIITVPINPEFGSLNLAQAVILVAYEWSKGVALASPPEVDLPLPAPQAELDGMIAQLDAMLVESDFFFPPARTPVTRRTLRTLLTKPGWSTQEVRTMRGVLSSLSGKKPRGS
ncbi:MULTISPECIES: TrmH family RNA methyltransferase [unclassified Sphingomonas]|uniref:TrmH family RNA methyltransferase n=1 Tax=unclassified Sphingomonas TaxID=196159 RepID=UPI0002898117|nr:MULTISPECIES: TrmH family RNA methyltransferase [unclassified Sphingomonas]